ncbi:transglutaminase-like domain-containing protein [Streptomyces spirodelae]|uniref:Transglutaminase family protein n=1 Tax=Streptomyces spirodelae TaxID=2812904 RepID=A0ABS3WME1_9ACTN|nr:transglutaminase family protein [Streptomyces spirodelae]MBO8184286.1 transglutaminase family protein [Streptomyces spirodelae]
MMLTPVTADESAYLAADDVVDHTHPLVRETAARLSAGTDGELAAYARAAYEFVRDAIPHSADVGDWRITWRASDVLAERVGICHAKSHALVALLRAEGIPAGFCYQKLNVLHGLVALRLPGSSRWVRQDARGNKPGVDAQFSLDREQLAFSVWPEKGECDYPVLYAEPHPVVLRALRHATDRAQLWQLLDTAL